MLDYFCSQGDSTKKNENNINKNDSNENNNNKIALYETFLLD